LRFEPSSDSNDRGPEVDFVKVPDVVKPILTVEMSRVTTKPI
jgi:hypothetical protein